MVKEKICQIFKMTEEKKKVACDLGIMLVFVSLVMLVAYKVNGIYPFGDETVARGDMTQQTIPAGMYYVWDVLHGDASPIFTWNSAFGMNIAGASSLGAFMSPLNWFLYFTSRSEIVDFVNILLILKMIATSFAMYFYLRKYKASRLVPVIGGLIYAFGAASLVHFQIIMVMDAAFLLPLIMLGAERIFRAKGCVLFTLSLSVAMMVNVYTGCMMLIFVFLYCGFRLMCEQMQGKRKKTAALHLGLSVVFALLLSAFATIPAWMCISASSRMGSNDLLTTYVTTLQAKWSESDWKSIERMFVNIALPASVVFYALFRNAKMRRNLVKQYKAKVFMLSVMAVSVLVPGIELLWHGGSRACWPLRFIYMISFVLIDLAVALYRHCENEKEETSEETKKTGMVLAVAAVCAIVAGPIFSNIYEKFCKHATYGAMFDGFLCIALEVVFIGLYLTILRTRKYRGAFVILLCIELTCTSVFSFAPNKDVVETWSPTHLVTANNVAKSLETEIGDFHRIKNTDYRVDHMEYSLVMGKESISNYWHVIDPELQPKFAALGYTINWTQLLDTGGTLFSDTLLGIQYNISKAPMPEALYEHVQDLEGYEGDVLGLYKNKLELPFAIGTDCQEMDSSGERFDVQNRLFKEMTGSSTPLIENVTSNLQGNRYTLNAGADKKLLYFYSTNQSDSPITVTVNGNPVIIPSSSGYGKVNYPSDFCNGIVFLGCFENQNGVVEFSGDTSQVQLGLMDYNTLVSGIESIKSANPKVTNLEKNHTGLELELENVTKPYVFLPVIDAEGWSCKVNGAEKEIQSVTGMITVPVSSGNCKIELDFTPPGQGAGTLLTVFGIILSIAVLLFGWKVKVPEEQKEATERIFGIIAYGIYTVIFMVTVGVMFVIPILYYLRGILVLRS